MAQLRPHVHEVREKAELVVIGSGTPDMARDFQQQFSLDFPVFTDPGRLAFQALGLRRGFLSSLKPQVALRAIRAVWNGARQGSTQGDPWQQGGALVVEPPGRLVWEHRNADPSDHPPIDAMLAAVRQARAG